jgi:phosphopantothenoylcysteine decarboxylase / phosphopantothenate---cysteine ligase
MYLKKKKILIGLSGSIAAYKIATLIRLLVKTGAEVKVVMTPSAKAFITPLTLSTLSKNPVLVDFFDEKTGGWTNHVELALWADLLLIAPASANTLAKCANGICDNLLIATYLSAKCQVVFAPAMDLDMFQHFSTQKNIETLSKNGNSIVEPNTGELASGLEGKGRMAEPEELLEVMEFYFGRLPDLKEKKILVSAGPTQEAIDPVRYISNHSTGKMGFEIANAFAKAGAEVTLVAGPTALNVAKGIQMLRIHSAQEMFETMVNQHPQADIVVFAAAVADYRPKEVADQKLKKTDSQLNIELERTVDIANFLGQSKRLNQIHIGFALETNDELLHAKGKLERKNFDMVVLNSLQDKGAGFRYDTNKVTILEKSGHQKVFDLKTKKEVAQDILETVLAYIKKQDK